ncbi:hypothetical protein BCR44DRAFT_1435349 [Catenaria anguillulae PL171]|uniref:SYO1-like TPR repeats domain-containing protein n=1 Tax=Catenaria anguillulae PL171 TaxID=765915 RepID=A0A1Y2HJV1_9FUNG|nr:hypothetical protein BCR44DRAFT_1435349 [Catenaria anguillulae PL171]
MGKVPTKKRSGTKQRHNPTGLASVAQVQKDVDQMMDETSLDDDTETANSNAATIASVPLLAKLIAKDAGDRAWAAAGVANMVSDPTNRKILLSKGLIDRLLSSLQIEVHPEVLLEMTGALRNLVLNDPTVANELGKKGIMLGIERILVECRSLLDKQAQGVPAANNAEEDARRAVHPLTTNAFTLLNALCVASRAAISATTQAPTTMLLLMNVVRRATTFPLSVVTSAMALLEVLTEDNVPAHRMIPADVLSTLPTFLDATSKSASIDSQVGISAAGVLYNLRNVAQSTDWIGTVLSFLHAYLASEATQQLVPETITYLTSAPEPGAHSTDDTMMEVDTEQGKIQVPVEGTVDKKFEALTQRAASAAAALELLANLTSNVVEPGVNDSDEWAEDEQQEGEEQDEAMDDEDPEDGNGSDAEDPLIADLAAEVGVNELMSTTDDAELVNMVNSSRSKLQHTFAATVPALVALAQTQLPHLADDATNNMGELATQLTTLRIRALAVLNNVFFAVLALPVKKRNGHPFPLLNLIMTPGAKGISPRATTQGLYDALAAVLDATNGSAELVAMAVGAMWGLLRNFDSQADMGAASWVRVPLAQIQALSQLYWTVSDTEARVKVIGLLGVLGKRQPGHIEGNRVVGPHLLNLLRTPSTLAPEVLAEVLDAVYDVYGDKGYDYDIVFRQEMKGLAILKAAYDGVKAVAKGVDRRRNRAVRDALDGALTNLRAFVRYKEQEYRS